MRSAVTAYRPALVFNWFESVLTTTEFSGSSFVNQTSIPAAIPEAREDNSPEGFRVQSCGVRYTSVENSLGHIHTSVHSLRDGQQITYSTVYSS